ncbi:MAG: alanine racemase [Candidatus Aminicenantales bacterium]
MARSNYLQWVEIDRAALVHNIRQFRRLIGGEKKLLAVVKANAYGHGIREVSRIALEAGADWLGVNSLEEGIGLRELGIRAPVLVLGAVALGDLKEAAVQDLRLTVYHREAIQRLGAISAQLKKKIYLHIKLETGTHRQGVRERDLLPFIKMIEKFPGLILEGISSHFANIEDTTAHTYPRFQLDNFNRMLAKLKENRICISLRHMSCTAAALLFPETHFDMVRVGIGIYGLWPSRETYLSCLLQKRKPLNLRPVLSWKARIAQVKKIPRGSFIGYGCTFRTMRAALLAVIPVGYYDGYSRHLSNSSYVLIRGIRAAVRGRVAMNFITADVTDIPGVRMEDEVTLIGQNGRESITADYLASLSGTIGYEIVTRINPLLPRIVV